MYINKVFLYGNLTRDPQLRSLPSGIQVAEVGVATNRTWKSKDGAKQEASEFHNCVSFGKQAELISQYLRKGSGIFVEGRIQTRSWDAQDGTKKYRTEIVVENFQFGPKSGSSGNYSSASSASQNDASAPKQEAPAEQSQDINYPEEEVNAEDIPF
jgi:single-strand DNA-binding protein